VSKVYTISDWIVDEIKYAERPFLRPEVHQQIQFPFYAQSDWINLQEVPSSIGFNCCDFMAFYPIIIFLVSHFQNSLKVPVDRLDNSRVFSRLLLPNGKKKSLRL
jgi:hypothetical protein